MWMPCRCTHLHFLMYSVSCCHAVPGNAVDNSDALKALSKAVTDGVGKPEKVRGRITNLHHM